MVLPGQYLREFSEPPGYVNFASVGPPSHRAVRAVNDLMSGVAAAERPDLEVEESALQRTVEQLRDEYYRAQIAEAVKEGPVEILDPAVDASASEGAGLGVMMAINLQTSFLTPPFGFALFYLRGVAPAEVTTAQIYRGVIPFVAIQLGALLLLALFPALVTWLPAKVYGG